MGNSAVTARSVAFGPNAMDIKGKNVFITGANTGIGKSTARTLAMKGANVYFACRNQIKTEITMNEIEKEVGTSNLHFLELDLSSFSSVRKAASEFKEKNIPLHLLINNAGIMACPFKKTEDGFESQMAVNHLGHFLLTNLLIPELRNGGPSRIINVSSRAHKRSHFKIDDINFNRRRYNPYVAYSNSKLANVLFTRSLHHKLQSSGVTAYSLHPGVVSTEIVRNNQLFEIFFTLAKFGLKSPDQGAATTVHCAVTPGLEVLSGEYFADCALSETSDDGKDLEMAEQLWNLSKKYVELTDEELAAAWGPSDSNK